MEWDVILLQEFAGRSSCLEFNSNLNLPVIEFVQQSQQQFCKFFVDWFKCVLYFDQISLLENEVVFLELAKISGRWEDDNQTSIQACHSTLMLILTVLVLYNAGV